MEDLHSGKTAGRVELKSLILWKNSKVRSIRTNLSVSENSISAKWQTQSNRLRNIIRRCCWTDGNNTGNIQITLNFHARHYTAVQVLKISFFPPKAPFLLSTIEHWLVWEFSVFMPSYIFDQSYIIIIWLWMCSCNKGPFSIILSHTIWGSSC